jgi:hypothetical protein
MPLKIIVVEPDRTVPPLVVLSPMRMMFFMETSDQ